MPTRCQRVTTVRQQDENNVTSHLKPVLPPITGGNYRKSTGQKPESKSLTVVLSKNTKIRRTIRLSSVKVS